MPSAGSMRVRPRVSPMLRLPGSATELTRQASRMRITVAAPFSCSRSERPLAAKDASRTRPSSPGPARRHIDRQKIVGTVDGTTVCGEIDERGVAALNLAFELDESAAHGAAPDILCRDHGEAELYELLRDRF